MSQIRIYDLALCCNTGVCGTQVDPVLPRFAADLEWSKGRGPEVVRLNLAHDPAQFITITKVQQVLQDEGLDCLPLILVDGELVSRCEYPSRAQLARSTETELQQSPPLPVANRGCCGDSGYC